MGLALAAAAMPEGITLHASVLTCKSAFRSSISGLHAEHRRSKVPDVIGNAEDLALVF